MYLCINVSSQAGISSCQTICVPVLGMHVCMYVYACMSACMYVSKHA